MSADSLTIEAKARLFDQLIAHQPVVTEAVTALARSKACELIISHKARFRSGDRGLNQADFGLDSLSAAHEIITGFPLRVDQIIQEVRDIVEATVSAATGGVHVTEVGQN